ncbi:hypothetical protein LPB140_11255 [Sphingorhabdus lutea]|uniref:Uncharacterized protein n=1 Tax=Sphingorhabdus lutea TaxID=1913578 RepID=A0A1L3JDQ6_9SPHN|nr:hypothetical protein [Sphingorhabdus lutea]APG63265.1 hypothetical protein LPB140_11255 [Sphingorhabdus lutea]
MNKFGLSASIYCGILLCGIIGAAASPIMAKQQYDAGQEVNSDAAQEAESQIFAVDKNRPTIGFVGVGQIRIGMAQEAMLKMGFADPYAHEKWQSDEEYAACHHISNEIDYPYLNFMIVDGKLARIENHQGGWPVYKGGEIGMTIAQMKAIYGDELEQSLHPYGGDDMSQDAYLTLTSMGKTYRAIFEIYEGKVTGYRFGASEAVGYIEGCA